MEYQPKSSPNLNEPVGFGIDNLNVKLVPSIKWGPREIVLTCGEFARRCGNCLNRNAQGRCVQSGFRSGTICSKEDTPCVHHELRK